MLETADANIRIVLVEPAGPLNVGSVARVMKNMGLHQLVLVNPQCDYLGEEARLMAVRAADILETTKVVESLPAALVGCVRAIATTGDDCRSLPTQLEEPADALPWLLEAPSALIFGREDCGLTNAELNRAQRLIRIPSSDAYTSLNLAQAVAICCYELYREEGRRKKEEGRRKREEGRRKREEGRGKKMPRSLAQPGNAYPEALPLQYPMPQIIYQLVTKNNLQPARHKIPPFPSPVLLWKI